MVRLRLLQPYNNAAPGETIDLPGGIASVLALRGIGDLAPEREEDLAGERGQATLATASLDAAPGEALLTVPASPLATRDVPGPRDARRRHRRA